MLHLNTNSPYNRNQTTKKVHRLVLATFAPIPGWEDLIVNHKDSVRSNNYLYNLEWTTSKENTIHGLVEGYKMIQNIEGVQNPMAKLTEQDVIEIAELIKSGKYQYGEIAKIYDVSSSAIISIAHNKSWKHMNLDINPACLRISNTFSNEDIHKICKFFESHDINNLNIYPSIMSLLKDCLKSLELDNEYNLESCRKSLTKILRKSPNYESITSQYKYTFTR